jgi:hypothetical protein
MTTRFVIESRDRGASLILSAFNSEYFLAQTIHPGLDATARVGTYMSDGFGDFFAGLATSWTGWDGMRRWESLEGELALTAVSDRAGHVYVSVHLHDGAPPRWTVELRLTLEAGQLEKIAARARQFEESAMSAT